MIDNQTVGYLEKLFCMLEWLFWLFTFLMALHVLIIENNSITLPIGALT